MDVEIKNTNNRSLVSLRRERESRVIASDSIIDRVVVVGIETLAASSFERSSSEQSVEDAVIQQ